MPGCLEGIKIVELGHWLAVPAAITILSDWGAEVIKIEPLVGDAWRGLSTMGLYPFEIEFNAAFEMDNRNKRSIALNLKQEKGRKILFELVQKADVFVTNMAPDALPKLGADYETLVKVNPKIIYGIVSGYGDRGPDKDQPGFDWSAYWGRSGIMLTLGEPGGPPLRARPGIGDHPSGLAFAAAICGALFCRERTGVAQRVSVALLNCGMWTLGSDVSVTLASGKDVPRIGREESANPLALSYKTKDDKWIFLTMPQSDPFWPGLCRAIKREDLINDPKYVNAQARADNRKTLTDMLDKIIITKTRDEWAEIFTANGVVFGMVQRCADLPSDPQANEFFTTVQHPTYGKLKVLKSPGEFSETPARIRSCAPELGQHTEEILLEMGYGWEDIAQFKEQGTIL